MIDTVCHSGLDPESIQIINEPIPESSSGQALNQVQDDKGAGMLSLNRAQILGNLTRDPEMRYTPNGQAVTHFSVATNRKWKNTDGTDGESVEYHEIVVWGKQAENITPMLKKGEPVFVEGRLQTRSWEGQDGVKRYKTEIVSESVIVLGRKGSGEWTPKPANNNPVEQISQSDTKTMASKQEENKGEEIDIEDIPF